MTIYRRASHFIPFLFKCLTYCTFQRGGKGKGTQKILFNTVDGMVHKVRDVSSPRWMRQESVAKVTQITLKVIKKLNRETLYRRQYAMKKNPISN